MIGGIVIPIPNLDSKVDVSHDRMEWGHVVKDRQEEFAYSTIVAWLSGCSLYRNEDLPILDVFILIVAASMSVNTAGGSLGISPSMHE